MQELSKDVYQVVLLGMSNVGKTSIAFYLEHGFPPPRVTPTIAFGVSHVVMNNVVLGLIDVGGQRRFLDMRYHEQFVRRADGLVFVVDSSKRDFARDEQWLADALELSSKRTPILVIANKQDLPSALSPEFLGKNMFAPILEGRYEYSIFGTVASDPGGIRSGENIELAFHHLIQQMQANRELLTKPRGIQI
ncbi:MAG: ADP-ribosylation factor-like protein [Candidatus Heimdallarchaeota archaeon]